MSGSEIPDLQGVFRFVSRLHTMSKRGMRGALADCPRCHFGMLENLHILIEQRGVEGAIYVSEVARAMRQPMPAVSRGLRMMEQDGSIVRETDPNDRRKTFVRITPQGEQARLQSEAALNAYFGRIMARMTPEQIDQMYALRGVLLDAIEAENDAMQKKISTQKQGGPVEDENIYTAGTPLGGMPGRGGPADRAGLLRPVPAGLHKQDRGCWHPAGRY